MGFDLKIANPTLDVQILQLARDIATPILERDVQLALPEHAELRQLKQRYAGKESTDFSMIS
jgi:ATP-dependent DNA helicase RecG